MASPAQIAKRKKFMDMIRSKKAGSENESSDNPQEEAAESPATEKKEESGFKIGTNPMTEAAKKVKKMSPGQRRAILQKSASLPK